MSSLATTFTIPLPKIPYPIIDITDPGKDLDDEQKFVLLSGLQRAGIVDIAAVIANLEPPLERARLAKGTFTALGLGNIPVGVGTDCFKGGHNSKHETDVPYLASAAEVHPDGHRLLVDTLGASDDASVVLMLNSGLTDAADLVKREPALVKNKVRNVTIMGGVQHDGSGNPLLVDGFLVPDDAANNAFDQSAAEYLYRALQELGIPLTVMMRSACYHAQFPIRLYDRFAQTGHPVGISLQNRQKSSIQQLWQAALAPAGSPVRGKLPLSRNRAWFAQVFCSGTDPGISYDEEIWPYVGTYNQYDPMAIMAAIPELRDRFFTPIIVEVKGTPHHIIGLTPQLHGIADKADLIAFMSELEISALTAAVS